MHDTHTVHAVHCSLLSVVCLSGGRTIVKSASVAPTRKLHPRQTSGVDDIES